MVEDGAVLGKRPRLRAGSSAAGGEIGALVLESDVTVCCGAVVYAGAHVAARAIIGDQAQVRERARIGAGSVVGRGSSVDFDAQVGARVLIQTGVYVTGGLGRRGRRVPRAGRADHQRPHDGPPPARERCSARRSAAHAGWAAARCSCRAW